MDIPKVISCADCLQPVALDDTWHCIYCEKVGLCSGCGNRHDHDCDPKNQESAKQEDLMAKKEMKKLKDAKKPKPLRDRVIVGKIASCVVVRVPKWAAEKINLVPGDVVRIGTIGKQLQIAHTAKAENRAKLRKEREAELAKTGSKPGPKKKGAKAAKKPAQAKKAVKKAPKPKVAKKAVQEPSQEEAQAPATSFEA
jgi:ribosomal protein L18E